VEKLRRLLPDYGKDLAVDSKALATYGRKDSESVLLLLEMDKSFVAVRWVRR